MTHAFETTPRGRDRARLLRLSRRLGSFALISTAAWLGCANEAEVQPATESAGNFYSSTTHERDLQKSYPDIKTLYTGDFGIYRGCGPNNGVCHNSREFPNLSTMGSLIESIGLPCNEKRDDPTQLHDLCERKGDLLRVGAAGGVEIAFVDADASAAPRRIWKLHLREPVRAGSRWTIVRATETNGHPNEIPLVVLGDFGATVRLDPSDASGRTVIVNAPPVPPPGNDENETKADVLGPLFDGAGVPGNPLNVQVGDPNRNGTFGASLGGRLIAPGDPAKSYLFTRLTDPSAGPLMPRANCCFWTKAALRAMWCWVAGLDAAGKNALNPISYDACPPGPPDTVAYPTPGPACETSGMCPVQPSEPGAGNPTFTNVYGTVLKPACTGSCHVPGTPGRHLDMSTAARAYASLVNSDPPRVVPGSARESLLFQRIDPELCSDDCNRMPLGQPPLPAARRTLVESWIAAGARND